MVHGLEAAYWGQVDFVYLDRENPNNAEAVDRFGVRYQPYFFLLDAEGNITDQWIGGVTESELRTAIDGLLAAGG